MGDIIEGAAFEEYPVQRQNYVRFAHEAMGWWIEKGMAGTVPGGADPTLAPRDQVIMAWASATGADPSNVVAAVKSQADHMKASGPTTR